MPILLGLRQNPYSLPSDLCAIRGFGQFEIIESTRLRGPWRLVALGWGYNHRFSNPPMDA